MHYIACLLRVYRNELGAIYYYVWFNSFLELMFWNMEVTQIIQNFLHLGVSYDSSLSATFALIGMLGLYLTVCPI